MWFYGEITNLFVIMNAFDSNGEEICAAIELNVTVKSLELLNVCLIFFGTVFYNCDDLSAKSGEKSPIFSAKNPWEITKKK